MTPEVYTVTQALEKATKYCAYQERCQQEVRQKLTSFQLTSNQIEDIAELIQQNYLNEERFSEAYARGKFRMKSWGKKKITLALRQKEISEYCIKKGMLQIEDTEYITALNTVLEKNYLKYAGIQDYQRAAKTAQYAIGRGFESSLVWQQLKNFTND
ncbi:MAG: regulatory protein [Halieaceae bacterium]|jgi:regulatory protein